MDPCFPADGWPRHVTWVGRWRLPQTVRAGLETLRLQPPSVFSWELPLSVCPSNLHIFRGLSFPFHFFSMEGGCIFSSPVLHSGSGGAQFLCNVPGGWRRAPAWDPFWAKGRESPWSSALVRFSTLKPHLGEAEGRGGHTAEERRRLSVAFSSGRPIEGSILLFLSIRNDSLKRLLGLVADFIPGLNRKRNVTLSCLLRLGPLPWRLRKRPSRSLAVRVPRKTRIELFSVVMHTSQPL